MSTELTTKTVYPTPDSSEFRQVHALVCEVAPGMAEDGLETALQTIDLQALGTLLWIAVYRGDFLYAVATVEIKGPIRGEFHFATWPEFVGKNGRTNLKAARAAIAHVFATTPIKKLIACVPDYCEGAISLMEAAGFSREGVSPEAVIKDGELHNIYYFGLKKN